MAGIYIHVPFCKSKCVYCGFYSTLSTSKKQAYLDALTQEIRLRKDYLPDSQVQTIYFGGGTPSILAIEELATILQDLRATFVVDGNAEITLEANPEQLTLDYCQSLRTLGFNRLSIGIQSFQDHVLQFMGRRHTSAEAIRAVDNARQAGFTNLSIDLIYGVAERTDEQWLADLRTAFSLPVQHLSCYALTPEENSILYKQIQNGRHIPVDDEQATRQYQLLLDHLQSTPFEHYEVSNFAIPGYESRHNSSYWNHTPYLGLGPAAHSFNGSSRQWNPANLNQYLSNIEQGITYDEIEMLSDEDLHNEFILLALRTKEGIDLSLFEQRFGTERRQLLQRYFHEQVSPEHYEQASHFIRLTEEGLWFADGIAGEAFEEL